MSQTIKLPTSARDMQRGYLVSTYAGIRGFSETFKPHKVRLSKNGRKFDPKYGAIGSTVVFEVDGKRMTGQVWSMGPERGQRWVVVDQKAYLVIGGRA